MKTSPEVEALIKIYNRLYNMERERLAIKPENFTKKQWADYKSTTNIILDTLILIEKYGKK